MSRRPRCGIPVRRATAILLAVVTVAAAGCGDDSTTDGAATDGTNDGAANDTAAAGATAGVASTTGGTASDAAGDPGVAPTDMCDNDQVPQAFAYDIDDGTLRWVSCTDGQAYRSVLAATDDAVYLTTGYGPAGPQTVALDPTDGTVLTDAPPPPAIEQPTIYNDPIPIEVDGYTVTGSQEGPISGNGGDDGEPWTQPGRWVYSDVWAIDDGAVFAVELPTGPDQPPPRLVAYEIPTGEIRWEYAGDPYGEGLWPWHAEDGRLYTLWGNVQVRDTRTGDLIWTTTHPIPPPTFPPPIGRFAGVAIHDDTAYVGYGTASSGGD